MDYQRVRSRSEPSTTFVFRSPDQTRIIASKSQTFKDFIIPGFLARSARGEIFNNPMQKIVNSVDEFPVYATADGHRIGYPSAKYSWKGYSDRYYQPAWPTSGVDVSYHDNLAVTKAHANVGDGIVDALVTGAELNETINCLASTGIKAAKVFRDIRRFNLKALCKRFSPSEVRDQYLNFRYGLRPTYYDLRDIHEFLTVKRNKTDRRTSRGQSEGNYIISSDTYWNTSSQTYIQGWTTQPQGRMCFARETGYKVKSRAGVLSSVVYEDNISRLLSELGVDRPISAVWELIPFSFMIDWFVNIGNTIRSWEPKPHCEELASWCVTEVEKYRKSVCTSVIFTDIGYKSVITSSSFTSPVHIQKEVTTTRTVNPSLAVLPSVNIRLDLAKIIDMGAIWSGLRDSKVRLRW